MYAHFPGVYEFCPRALPQKNYIHLPGVYEFYLLALVQKNCLFTYLSTINLIHRKAQGHLLGGFGRRKQLCDLGVKQWAVKKLKGSGCIFNYVIMILGQGSRTSVKCIRDTHTHNEQEVRVSYESYAQKSEA